MLVIRINNRKNTDYYKYSKLTSMSNDTEEVIIIITL